jgi:O-methyltransferase
MLTGFVLKHRNLLNEYLMVNFSCFQKIKHLIKRIPFMEEVYDFITTVFSPDYAEDGIRVSKNCSFLKDPDFIRGYKALLNQEPGTKTRWRAHITQWAGFYASQLPGDFVETGVNKAAFSSSVMEYLDFKNIKDRKFYLFDTYEGMVEDQISKNERAAFKHDYKNTYEFVVKTFKDFDNVVIVKGIVPESLDKVNIEKVAYLSIDMNCAEPERAALEFFWPKLVSGGIVILDDYVFSGRELQQKSADEFAKLMGVKILSLPTGQGIILKT